MQNKLKLAVLAFCCASMAFAQNTKKNNTEQTIEPMDESAFTFTEAQLGEDNDMTDNVTILNSNSNVYASEVGFLFSPVRFRYRALNQKYNDVYINGAPMNDMESGQFRYSMVGGLNQQTRNVDFSLPFEDNTFSMTGMAGSNNYDFRAGSMAAGHRLTLSAANRNYTLRGMYTYASGFNSRGWAIAGNVTYRWANRGYAEGTFYNALSYFFGVQKRWNNGHSLAISTWGNPTERSTQGASTDEAYWLANDYYYNPYWGYQNGHKRNSRVVNDFAPSAIATWDWDINKNNRLTTSLFGKYSSYKSTKLNYNNAENPHPDYWKTLPSSYFNVWDETDYYNRTDQALADWTAAYNFWTASKANRQINWDKLYYANKQAAAIGRDALYYLQAKHNDNTTVTLSSKLTSRLDKNKTLNVGFTLGQNLGRHYQTLEDMLGASTFHNINSYTLGDYPSSDPRIHYDLNTAGTNGLGKLVYEGDKFGYDYTLKAQKGLVWASFTENYGALHYNVSAKLAYDRMQRKGHMRNGMFADFSFGKSEAADFVSGGVKASASTKFGQGGTLMVGLGYEHRAPQILTAFVSPEMSNDFVDNLRNERIFSSEISYQYQNTWLHANLSAYYNRMTNVTEWQNFYFDDENSFTYVSMRDIKKHYYGLELGMRFKLASFLDLVTIGTISDAKNFNNAKVRYMLSTKGEYIDDIVYNKGMRESGTPLTAGSIGLSFHQGGWFIDLNANYYDRIYLSYAPNRRYGETIKRMNYGKTEDIFIDPNTAEIKVIEAPIPEQAKGHGGWMIDGSIGKNIRIGRNQSLSINFMVANILNNRKIVSGGYEQSRSSYTTTSTGELNNTRAYSFTPKKYYVFGTNGMLNLAYKF